MQHTWMISKRRYCYLDIQTNGTVLSRGSLAGSREAPAYATEHPLHLLPSAPACGVANLSNGSMYGLTGAPLQLMFDAAPE